MEKVKELAFKRNTNKKDRRKERMNFCLCKYRPGRSTCDAVFRFSFVAFEALIRENNHWLMS